MSKSNRKIDCGYDIDRENIFFIALEGIRKMEEEEKTIKIISHLFYNTSDEINIYFIISKQNAIIIISIVK